MATYSVVISRTTIDSQEFTVEAQSVAEAERWALSEADNTESGWAWYDNDLDVVDVRTVETAA